MGFGILFIGYILTFVMSLVSIGYLVELVGALLMIYAFTKLSEYNSSFKFTFAAAIPLVITAVAITVINFMGLSGYDLSDHIITKFVVPNCKIVFNFIFHAMLFYAVADIAKDTECPRIRTAAYRNMIIYSLYFVLQIFVQMPFVLNDQNVFRVIGIFGNALWILWLLLDGIMIFSCYMHICDSEDTQMSARPSRFSVINKLRREFDEKEQRAREADYRYKQEKSERRKSRKNKKK